MTAKQAELEQKASAFLLKLGVRGNTRTMAEFALQESSNAQSLRDIDISNLLIMLDVIAQEVDHYEYGLPLYNKRARERMQNAIREWYTALTCGGKCDSPNALKEKR